MSEPSLTVERDAVDQHDGNVPAIMIETPRKVRLTARRLTGDRAHLGLVNSGLREDAFLACLQLRDLPAHELRRNGQKVPSGQFPAGSVAIYDLRDEWRIRFDGPYDILQLRIPRVALDEAADELGARRIKGLHQRLGDGKQDVVANSLGLTLLPALRRPSQTSSVFTDHVALALLVHLARTYGCLKPARVRSGLAPWQERRAKEMLSSDLDSDIPLSRVAGACSLSLSHFARGFKQSIGIPPHRWLLERRVDKARDLLLASELPLAEIAVACGFADQSHFNRVFLRIAGSTPGAWRRVSKNGSIQPARLQYPDKAAAGQVCELLAINPVRPQIPLRASTTVSA